MAKSNIILDLICFTEIWNGLHSHENKTTGAIYKEMYEIKAWEN